MDDSITVTEQTSSTDLLLLSVPEIEELTKLEGIVERGLQTFMEVGQALGEINAKRLWRQTHHSFPDYVQERFGIKDKRAYQLIGAASTGNLLAASAPDIPQPTNEAQVRPLQVLAPERRAMAWREAVQRSDGSEITRDDVQAVVDEMTGKAGRFDAHQQYPIWDQGKLVFNAGGKSDDLWKDPRFKGCGFVEGSHLNQNKKYEAYALVDVPEFQVPLALQDALPTLKGSASYPVNHAEKIIYDAPFGSGYEAKHTYADCEWENGWAIQNGWLSIISRFGEFKVVQARAISTDWLAESAFQPGMAATCPKCAAGSSWMVGAARKPYEDWRPIEPGVWLCKGFGHTIGDADLVIQTGLAEMPAAEGLGGQADDSDQANPDEAEADENVAPDVDDILNNIAAIDDLLGSIRDTPDLVKLALDPATLKAFRDQPWHYGHPSDETLDIVKVWLAVDEDAADGES